MNTPMQIKLDLALELVSRYHGAEVARRAVDEWMRVFSNGEVPAEVPLVVVAAVNSNGVGIVQLVRSAGLAKSGGEARRLVAQSAVHLDGVLVASLEHVVAKGGPMLLRGGRR